MSAPVGRRAGRRQALFLLYQWDLTGQELASLYEGEPDEYARELAAPGNRHAIPMMAMSTFDGSDTSSGFTARSDGV